ncbi:predicted protein [Nematostella vectensis]|uniref:Uncharacterized protein n=1 Tax=Nematostella vectensis TaxID=45351 RepID=A7SIM7_NEMVE|nr:predicted protein [Nematostella vectensis]EDO36435.1 predicted protein [Nematostella vectensis]|eukprot:XP_001622493.1 predicted protein [Nematostella vectensis]
MPKTTRRTRNSRKKDLKDQVTDTESDSGKLSETQEVARRLSRTRLGKENAVKQNSSHKTTPIKGPADPYDADSEVESDPNMQETIQARVPMSPMVTDTHNLLNINIPLSAIRPQQMLKRVLSPAVFTQEHSTPSNSDNSNGKSNDSLFGFGTAMESPLTFSPIVTTANPVVASSIASPTGSTLSVTSLSSTSPGKRKLQLRLFDVPLEKPAKKQKKKKPKPVKNENEMHHIATEFEEVEMFDLVIQ